MNYKLSLLFILTIISIANAQIEIEEKPYSFQNPSNSRLDFGEFNSLTLNKSISTALKEDVIERKNGMPPRFGLKIETNFNTKNSGEWSNLPDGSKIWKLHIKSPKAKSINLIYDAFHLPPEGRFHIYNVQRTHVIGAFTELNNKGSMKKPGKFATGLVYGDGIILEYFHPSKAANEAVISIKAVIHGYKYIKILNAVKENGVNEDYGDSGPCQVNVNCTEGNNWQNEKKGVAMLLINDGTRWCTGSLVNNTSQNRKPYFLTADHCLDADNLDVAGNRDASDWMFYWNYETPDCPNTAAEPTINSTTGAILRANRTDTDFALFELLESPLDACYDVYFNGWDRTTNLGQGGVGIHHPGGDVKKIATHNMVPVDGQIWGADHWRVNWVATANGHSVTEGNSSGSPLFSNNGRIIGQLHGGSSVNCDDPENDPGEYGKFHLSWNGSSSNRRLRDWLAPGSNRTWMWGRYFNPATVDLSITYLESDFEMYVCASVVGGTAPFKWYINGVLRGTTSTPSFCYRYRCQGGTSTIGVITNTPCGQASDTESYYENCNGSGHRMSLYPNPASSEFNIASNEATRNGETIITDISAFGEMEIQIMDFSGKKVLDKKFKANLVERKVDVSNLKKGNYFVRIQARELDEVHQIVVE